MKKLVAESLELFEKEKAVVVQQSKKAKYKEAIAGLKKELKKVNKPGASKTTLEKNAKIKNIMEKIAKYKEKLK